MAVFKLLESRKLISRKIWVIEKFWNFNTFCNTQYGNYGIILSDLFESKKFTKEITENLISQNIFLWHQSQTNIESSGRRSRVSRVKIGLVYLVSTTMSFSGNSISKWLFFRNISNEWNFDSGRCFVLLKWIMIHSKDITKLITFANLKALWKMFTWKTLP